MKKPGKDLASFKMSFMGRSAPGAAGGAAVDTAAAGAEPLAGVAVGTAGDWACTDDKVQRLKQAADSRERLKRVD